MEKNVWGIRIYTRTLKDAGNYKMYGVIEAPIHKMLKAFPNEFRFLKHETRREHDAKRNNRAKKPGAWYMATWVNIQVVKKFFKLHFIKKNLGMNELA